MNAPQFQQIIAQTFRVVFGYKKVLMKTLLLPFVAYVLIDAIDHMDTGSIVEGISWALSVVLGTILAVTTHRVILLGPASVSKWGGFNWGVRETVFTLHVIAIVFFIFSLSLIAKSVSVGIFSILDVNSLFSTFDENPLLWKLLIYIPFIIMSGISVVAFWVIGRVSLAFPAIAINQGVSFRSSWKLTRKHQLLVFLVVIVFPICTWIPIYLLGKIPYTAAVASVLSLLTLVFEIALLSVTYRAIYKIEYES